MITLGLILLILGFIFGIPVLWTIGIVLLVIGLILALVGATGRAIGGRSHWYCPSAHPDHLPPPPAAHIARRGRRGRLCETGLVRARSGHPVGSDSAPGASDGAAT